jgi:hypothetical protein
VAHSDDNVAALLRVVFGHYHPTHHHYHLTGVSIPSATSIQAAFSTAGVKRSRRARGIPVRIHGDLSLFLVHRLGTFRHHHGSTAHLLVSVPWIVAATAASFGRVREGRHFPVDCVAGVFAGVCMAMMIYKMTFEPVPVHQVNATHADDKFRTPVEPTLPMNGPESSREQEPSAADRNNTAPQAASPPSGHAVVVDADSENDSTHSGTPLHSSPSSSRSREREQRPRSSRARPSYKKRASRTPTGGAKG